MTAADPARPASAPGAPAAFREVDGARSCRAAWLAVVATVAVAFVVYAGLASTIDSPRVFSDELLYFDVAASVVEGDGLTVRGEVYRYAPLYPALLVPVHWVAPDREAAYALATTLNALLFALAAIPLFLLARRVLPAWPSVAVAALSVAIPSASYVSVVMTESVAYLACSWAFYAIVLTLERPTVPRQLAAILSIALAMGFRTQFVVLFAVYLLGLLLVALIVPGRSLRSKATLGSLWPTWGTAGLGSVALLTLAWRSDTSGPLGVYSVLWRSYDAGEVARWFVYHLANVELYLAVVPLVVAPIVLGFMFVRGRRGEERHGAYLALFVTANTVFLLLAAAFNSTEYAVESFHDRVLFYVVPLWLIVFFAWLHEGAPKPHVAFALGAGLALLLPVMLPFSEYAKDDARQQFNGVGTTLWAGLDEALAETRFTGRQILVAFVFVVVLAITLARARARLLPMTIVAVFVLAGALNWHLAARVATSWASVLPQEERMWLDRRVPAGRSVTALAAVATCRDFGQRDGFYLSEFFNASVTRVAHVGPPPDSLPAERVSVTRSGTLTASSGEPLVADYVLAQSGVPIDGRRIAEATSARLSLWETVGAVRVLGVNSRAELQAVACNGPPP